MTVIQIGRDPEDLRGLESLCPQEWELKNVMIQFFLPPNLGYETLKQAVFELRELINPAARLMLNLKVTPKEEFRWLHGQDIHDASSLEISTPGITCQGKEASSTIFWPCWQAKKLIIQPYLYLSLGPLTRPTVGKSQRKRMWTSKHNPRDAPGNSSPVSAHRALGYTLFSGLE